MTGNWDGLSENQKLCVKKEDRDKIKSECLVSEDRKEYGSGNGGASSREDTQYIRQNDTVGCLRSLHLSVLKCWIDLKYDVATTYENWVNGRAGRDEGNFTREKWIITGKER